MNNMARVLAAAKHHRDAIAAAQRLRNTTPMPERPAEHCRHCGAHSPTPMWGCKKHRIKP